MSFLPSFHSEARSSSPQTYSLTTLAPCTPFDHPSRATLHRHLFALMVLQIQALRQGAVGDLGACSISWRLLLCLQRSGTLEWSERPRYALTEAGLHVVTHPLANASCLRPSVRLSPWQSMYQQLPAAGCWSAMSTAPYMQALAISQWNLLPQKLLPLRLDTLKNGLLQGLEKVSLSTMPASQPAAEPEVPSLPTSATPSAFLDDELPVAPPAQRSADGLWSHSFCSCHLCHQTRGCV